MMLSSMVFCFTISRTFALSSSVRSVISVELDRAVSSTSFASFEVDIATVHTRLVKLKLDVCYREEESTSLPPDLPFSYPIVAPGRGDPTQGLTYHAAHRDYRNINCFIAALLHCSIAALLQHCSPRPPPTLKFGQTAVETDETTEV